MHVWPNSAPTDGQRCRSPKTHRPSASQARRNWPTHAARWDAWLRSRSKQTLSDARTPEETRKLLLAEYQEVCRSHAGITDFRAKLLALLPLASGAGVGVLVAQGDGAVSTTEAGLLVALGIFGAVVTAGLFLYELRQIDVCKQLRNHAAWIESELGIEAGQFGGRRPRLSLREVYSRTAAVKRDKDLTRAEMGERRDAKAAGNASPDESASGKSGEQPKEPWLDRHFIGAEAAGYVIYHAVIVAWLFAAVVGIANLI